MAEFTSTAVQTVNPDQAVLFTEVPVTSNANIIHREGSGIVTLRGLCCACQPRARFKATFGANIAIPTGGTVGPISVALSLNGEPVNATEMIVTPAAAENYFNVARTFFIDVPAGCCTQLSVDNTSTEAITVQNANLVVDRVL